MSRTAKDTNAGRKPQKGKKAASKTSAPPYTIAGTPRAAAHVRLAKNWGGLICFLLALALSLKASLPFTTSLERALLAGVAGYIVGWACAVITWRTILMAELRARAERIRDRRLELTARLDEQHDR